VWIAIVGELWKHRNMRIFRSGRIDPIEIFVLSQLNVWSWVMSKAREVCFSYSDRCLESMVCMMTIFF